MLKRSISFLNKSMIKFSSVRRFSTSSNLDKLASILNQEISHEEKNYQAVEKSELERFFKDTKFEFVDKEDSTRMELRKSHGNFDVVVNFTARAPNMQEEEQDDKQGQEEKGPENYNEFTVRVIKKGGKEGMLCNALALDNNFEVDTVMYLDDVNAFFNDTVLQGKPTDKYTGPEFHTLDERLQTEFVEFLTSLGIGEEVISFITVLSQDKDQRLYAKWLKDVAKFVSH